MYRNRILIIEDDLELLSILHDLFVAEGFEVIVYPDKNSIKGVIINRPDVVLLDEKLRDGFGHDLCKQIKTNDMTSSIPVILTSGHPDLRRLKDECGADDYINKPYDLNLLIATVHRHLQKETDNLNSGN